MVLLIALAESSIQLVPDGTLLIHIFLIVLMVFVLNKTLFKPINQVLEERDRSSRGALSEAHGLLARVESELRAYEGLLRGARTEGYRQMEAQRNAALKERELRLASVRAEVTSQIEREKRGIATQSSEARLLLTEKAQTLGLTISAQILGRPSTASDRPPDL